MKHPVRLERQSGIAVITIDNPPVNALGAAVRAGVLAGLEAAIGDPQIKAIVIAGKGRTLSAGADISEFGKARVDPDLPTLCNFTRRLACLKSSLVSCPALVVRNACHV